ncbi:MAG: hypothetical protein AAF590_06340 [Pseudomonadota bacterium]
MESAALATSSAVNAQGQIRTEAAQRLLTVSQEAEQQVVELIDSSTSNLQSVSSGSSTAPGVGTRLDRQV